MITSITIDDAQVQAVINALPSSIFKAEKSSVQQTATFVKNELNSRMATKTGIPGRVFRRFRVKSKNIGDGKVVWLGLNKVKASYVGRLKQDVSGAFAGQYFFAGGFVATMKSGHTGIFKNRGNQLDEQYVNINLGFQVASEVSAEAQQKLKQAFIAKVLELNPGL